MDIHTALAFQMASEHLERLLPAPTYSHLQPHFDHARSVLDGFQGAKMRTWPRKIRVVPSTMPISPAVFDSKILEDIQEGVLHEKQLLITYIKRGETKKRTYTVNPLAIVYRDAVAYLVCTFWKYDEIMQLKLHRMVETELQDTPRRKPKDFTLDEYIARGGMGFLVGKKPLKVWLRFEEHAAISLMESPMSDDQKVSKPKDGKVSIRATVADSHQIRAYIRSYGAKVEVMGPKSLREELAREAKALAKLYK
jgi:predicted DNA-binding transcriptional regulator YafY